MFTAILLALDFFIGFKIKKPNSPGANTIVPLTNSAVAEEDLPLFLTKNIEY